MSESPSAEGAVMRRDWLTEGMKRTVEQRSLSTYFQIKTRSQYPNEV